MSDPPMDMLKNLFEVSNFRLQDKQRCVNANLWVALFVTMTATAMEVQLPGLVRLSISQMLT